LNFTVIIQGKPRISTLKYSLGYVTWVLRSLTLGSLGRKGLDPNPSLGIQRCRYQKEINREGTHINSSVIFGVGVRERRARLPEWEGEAIPFIQLIANTKFVFPKKF